MKARPDKKGKPKLTDEQLIAQAKANKKLEKKIDKLAGELKDGKKIVVDEMEARGTRAIEHGGKRCTLVKGTYTSRDDEGLRAALKPKQRALVCKEVIDASALSQAVQAGQIDKALVDQYSEVKNKAAYYLLSDLKATK
jgi:hypothetical protein